MKDLLLIGITLFALVAFFGDGGLTISPEVSPELQAALEFSPALDVNYAPDRSVTTIETQVQGDYIENQTLIVNEGAPVVASGTVADGRPGGACITVPGDVIVIQGSSGECYVVNAGQKYFVTPTGRRDWLGVADASPATPTTSIPENSLATPATVTVELMYDQVTTDQLQANYLRSGKQLPFGFRFWSEYEKRLWLSARFESWEVQP